MASAMRIIFMGTPDFAVPTLDALHDAGHEVVAVYTQPPRPAGRGKVPQPSAVQHRAEALGIEVCTPVSLKSEAAQQAFAALQPDLAVVAAYGLILPQAILDAPVWDCLNVHASLLPRWRGAAPVQRAILAGDLETGVTIMAMEAGLDTGDMLAVGRTPIADKDAGMLTVELAQLGARLLLDVIADPGRHPPAPQPDQGVTYAAKIDKAESRLDFTKPAEQVERQVRAFAPTPGAWFEFQGERIRILGVDVLLQKQEPGSAADAGLLLSQEYGTVIDDRLTIACGGGAIVPTWVQRAGRGAMTPAELLRGFPIPPGTHLSPSPLVGEGQPRSGRERAQPGTPSPPTPLPQGKRGD